LKIWDNHEKIANNHFKIKEILKYGSEKNSNLNKNNHTMKIIGRSFIPDDIKIV